MRPLQRIKLDLKNTPTKLLGIPTDEHLTLTNILQISERLWAEHRVECWCNVILNFQFMNKKSSRYLSGQWVILSHRNNSKLHARSIRPYKNNSPKRFQFLFSFFYFLFFLTFLYMLLSMQISTDECNYLVMLNQVNGWTLRINNNETSLTSKNNINISKNPSVTNTY